MELFELLAAIRYHYFDIEIIEANGETTYKGKVANFLYSRDFEKKYSYDISNFYCDGKVVKIQLR